MPSPRRTDDELIALVHEKVDRLHHRRRQRTRAAMVGATILLLLTVATIGALRAGTHPAADLDTADQPGTTVTDETSPSTVPPVITPADPTSVAPPTTPPSAMSPTTTSPEPATTTTTPPACIGGNFTVSVAASSAGYASGEPVPVTITARNVGPECSNAPDAQHPDILDSCLFARVVDADGVAVWDGSSKVSCATILRGGPVPAGWTQTTSSTWDQTWCATSESCGGVQVPPGRYSITVSGVSGWLGVTVQPVTVTIT